LNEIDPEKVAAAEAGAEFSIRTQTSADLRVKERDLHRHKLIIHKVLLLMLYCHYSCGSLALSDPRTHKRRALAEFDNIAAGL
jgi:hypothetical protein